MGPRRPCDPNGERRRQKDRGQIDERAHPDGGEVVSRTDAGVLQQRWGVEGAAAQHDIPTDVHALEPPIADEVINEELAKVAA